MARQIHKLNDAKVKAASKPGRVSDGGGLFLRVSKSCSKSWSFMWTRNGQRDEFGMGPYPAVTLSAARKKAAHFRELIATGGNPRNEVSKEAEPNFSECVKQFLESNHEGWSNEKHRAQWQMTLGPAYCGKIQNKRPSEIGLADVLAILKPIWTTKTETATRIRGRIERVLNFAKTKGWRDGENPAAWRGNLDNILPKPSKLKNVQHHAAMPYPDVPAFLTQLRERQGLSARALELLIFTACRSGEVLNARWAEVDLENRVWTIPAERMKMKQVHSVPLTDPAYKLLQALHERRRDEWVFPGNKRDKPLSGMVLEMQLRRMECGHYTPHGFRSSFRDWAGDETEFPREVAEGCLAHKVGDATENAYRRSTAIKKRRNLLTAWANYISGASGEVVQINKFAG
ncbi:MAG: integrase arm-type DNA-binding domain-containing protein [Roseibium sp.]|uniref:tyrosine-type recombinase/integrase n=1 Tax=Roseibium sp. TaxID=1936156 RepID=UPI003D9C1671